MAQSSANLLPLILLLSSLLLLCNGSSIIVSSSRSKQLSWKPRAFVYQGFLTGQECDHLISLAKSGLKRSAVADDSSGKDTLSDVRTSLGMFISKGKLARMYHYGHPSLWMFARAVPVSLNRLRHYILIRIPPEQPPKPIYTWGENYDPTIDGIEDKIAAWTYLPKENGEDIQVLRYEPGQKYDPHYDYFSDKVNIARGGHRIATVLMYLTDVSKGGETVFPLAEESPRHGGYAKDDNLSECARKGIAVRPRRGDALLFFNLHHDATPDPSSLHAGCPVIEGEKWSATKWIHVASFDQILGSRDSCTDENEHCERWASLEECTKNSEYMVGTTDLPGFCRKSCRAC